MIRGLDHQGEQAAAAAAAAAALTSASEPAAGASGPGNTTETGCLYRVRASRLDDEVDCKRENVVALKIDGNMYLFIVLRPTNH